MSNSDPYATLGLERSASQDDVKKAFRRLAAKYHPDQATGDKKVAEEKFKEISAAYEVLSDPQKRQQYNQFGAGGPQFGGGQTGGFDFGGGQGFEFEGFGDIFESFFGQQAGGSRTRKRGPTKGHDLETALTIEFEEAVFGATADLNLQRIATCEGCDGEGAERGSKITTCKTCGGTGQIMSTKRTVFGVIQHAAVCPDCAGEGKAYEKKCSVCHGTGRVRATMRLKVRIPAGVSDGTTIKVAGQGDAGAKGGPAGDLFVHIAVRPHRDFTRRGADILSTEKIHVATAVLGGDVEIKTAHGKAPLTIPAGTQPGTTFTLEGQGAPKLGSERRGNHVVTITLNVPKRLSAKEKELYAELAKEAGLQTKKGTWF